MKTTIKDEVGVEMAGPDDPVLAAAKARDVGGTARVDARSPEQMSAEFLEYQDVCRKTGRPATNFEDWAERTFCGSFEPATGSLHATSIPAGKGMVEAERIGDLSVGNVRVRGGAIEDLGLTARQIEKRDMARREASGVREQAIQRGLMSGSAGPISREQAGILPMGRVTVAVTDDMVRRAQIEGSDCGQLLDERVVRAMLEAALRG